MVSVLTPYQDVLSALKYIKWLDLMIVQATSIFKKEFLYFNAYISVSTSF